MHLQESTLFDLDLQVKVTLNVAQYPLHHVTYAPTEFEVTTSKVLGGEAFTNKKCHKHVTNAPKGIGLV